MKHPSIWRRIQRQNFTSIATLSDYLSLSSEQAETLFHDKTFPLNLPRRLADKIKKGVINDPILLQFVPIKEELASMEEGSKDPVEEEERYRPTPRLLHKYPGRVLLLPTSACAMHCRYCFRRHFSYYTSPNQTIESFAEEIAYIQQNSSIQEVLLSGGDPLSLDTPLLQALISQLESIPHVTRLRFHTRFPIGIPERIDSPFLEMLQKSRLQVYMVLHVNHPDELDDAIFDACARLKRARVTLLTQTVLLKGVNDDATILAKLCTNLIDHGIIPYYLHQLDRVSGALHFEVSQAKGLALIAQLETMLPGYAVPRYVQEIPQRLHKTQLFKSNSLCAT
jgi:EF-P beta-lysylation protein EpmB